MIAVIGAGPAGSYLSYLLAKKGKEVVLLEEHDSIGSPVQCTGVVTSSILKILPLKKKLVVNKINRIRIHSSKENFVDINVKPNFVLDRAAFDKHLFNLAVKQGVEAHLSEKFLDYRKIENSFVIRTSKDEILSNYLVGCDGPLSKVGEKSKLIKKRKFFTGFEYRIRDIFDSDTVEIWLFDKGFGWVVPESATSARAGIMTTKKTAQELKNFFSIRFNKGVRALNKKAGIIPVFNPNEERSGGNVFLCGDAGGFVKASTGGGIVQSLISAECAYKAITKNKNYERLWEKRLRKDLNTSLRIRKILDKMKQKDRDLLIKLFSKPKLKKVLNNIDRDHAFKLLVKCAFREPRLLMFARFLL